ncbi:RnfABCDGE type electron transport complex subunit D [Desulfocurvus sp. DL9XJH121]
MTPPIIKPLAEHAGGLVVCPAPHLRVGLGVRGLMLHSLAALVPAVVMAVVAYGLPAARVMALTAASAVVFEAACQKYMGRDVDADNFSALYAGLLLSFLLPASAPWWLAVLGGALTAVIGRAVFGGLGSTPLCAPLVAWAMCRISWPALMDVDLSMASVALNEPLAQLKYFGVDSLSQFEIRDLFLGKALGALGASQVAALLAGGIFLVARRVIRFYVPLAFLAGVYVSALCFSVAYPETSASPLFHLLTGSVVFGAFFLATDTASSPVGRAPMLIYGFLAGVLVMVIRTWGVYVDGVPFAILLANLTSPLLDRVRPKPFGGKAYA